MEEPNRRDVLQQPEQEENKKRKKPLPIILLAGVIALCVVTPVAFFAMKGLAASGLSLGHGPSLGGAFSGDSSGLAMLSDADEQSQVEGGSLDVTLQAADRADAQRPSQAASPAAPACDFICRGRF